MLQSRRGVPTAGLALQWSDRSGFRFSGFAQHQGIADKYSDTQHTHECREVPGNLSGLQAWRRPLRAHGAEFEIRLERGQTCGLQSVR
jgi:hypothetical protein